MAHTLGWAGGYTARPSTMGARLTCYGPCQHCDCVVCRPAAQWEIFNIIIGVLGPVSSNISRDCIHLSEFYFTMSRLNLVKNINFRLDHNFLTDLKLHFGSLNIFV